MTVWLAILLVLLGAAGEFVLQDVIRTIRRTGRHAAIPAQPEQRGELLDLDWNDQRRPPPTPVKPAKPTLAP